MLQAGIAADSNCAARGIGYRQALRFLEACQAEPGHLTAEALVCVPVVRCHSPSAAHCCCIRCIETRLRGLCEAQRQAVADMQTASRQLCKRQLMWFRGDAMYDWLGRRAPHRHHCGRDRSCCHRLPAHRCGCCLRLCQAALPVGV